MGLDICINKINKNKLPEKYKNIQGELDDNIIHSIHNLLESDYIERNFHFLLNYFISNTISPESVYHAYFYYAISKEELKDIYKYCNLTLQQLIKDQNIDNLLSLKLNNFIQYLDKIINDNSNIYIFEMDR